MFTFSASFLHFIFLGAGKTYTMLGLDSEPGVYIRTLNDLFRAIEYSTEDLDCSVYMSYIEVSLIVCRY